MLWRQPGLWRRTSHSTSMSGIIEEPRNTIFAFWSFKQFCPDEDLLTHLSRTVAIARHAGDDRNLKATKEILNLLEVSHLVPYFLYSTTFEA